MNKLKNKVAVVTGGNSGIGYATAKELIAEGAKVIITGRRKEAVEKAAEELGAVHFVADQGKLEDIESLKNEIKNQFVKVDILFINAGVTGTLDAIENMSSENFDNVMDINFRGGLFYFKQIYSSFKRRCIGCFSIFECCCDLQSQQFGLSGE